MGPGTVLQMIRALDARLPPDLSPPSPAVPRREGEVGRRQRGRESFVTIYQQMITWLSGQVWAGAAAVWSSWGWQGPGTGCSLGAGHETWPGALSLACSPGWPAFLAPLARGIGARALCTPKKPYMFPTLIVSPTFLPETQANLPVPCLPAIPGSVGAWSSRTPLLLNFHLCDTLASSVITFLVGPS